MNEAFLTKKQFEDEVRDGIREYLREEYRDARIYTQEVLKDGDEVYTGLRIVPKNENSFPRIYLDDYYTKYRDGEFLEDILEELAERYHELRDVRDLPARLESLLGDRETLEKNISYRLLGQENNREYLSGRPWRPVEDLALVYSIEIEGVGRSPINNDRMMELGMTEEELFALASRNTPELHPPLVQTVAEMLHEPDFMGAGLVVITNTEQEDGAAAILYPQVREKIRDMLDGDYYILPSSVHEVIAVRKDPEDLPRLEKMVGDVNDTITDHRDILSSRVYDHTKEGLSIAVPEKVPERKAPDRSAMER